MKKILFLIVMSVAVVVNAQETPPPPGKMERMPGNPGEPRGPRPPHVEALKVAFITQQLNLTAEEAQKFWPIHNSYMAELKKAREANKDAELAFEEQALSIRKKYNNDFKKVLNSEERVNTVFKLDRNFNDMMRQEMMRRGMRPPGPNQKPDRPILRKRLMERNQRDSSFRKN